MIRPQIVIMSLIRLCISLLTFAKVFKEEYKIELSYLEPD